MAFVPKPITSAQLTTSAATYYTAPTVKASLIRQLVATNTTATNRTVTVYLVPSGGTAGAANELIITRIVPANDSIILWEALNQALATGGTIQALADAGTAVTLSGSVVEAS